eukprot:TRINITY_DN495_c3_g1_i1.p1 TRINITY_DN495_c3_g1~~TRINITY_DN495_c3_g1_i1.p1  ORF type:complete len:205 (+),score=59.58 TRINITY_DN495_c3_g1_i1:75-617(+)
MVWRWLLTALLALVFPVASSAASAGGSSTLVVLSAALTLAQAIASEEDGDLEEAQEAEDTPEEPEEEEDSLEEGEYMGFPDGEEATGDEAARSHPKHSECIQLMELVESEVSNFDEQNLSDEKINEIASRFAKNAVAVLGRKKEDFEEAAALSLRVIQKEGGAFGASDACELMLKHHDEL